MLYGVIITPIDMAIHILTIIKIKLSGGLIVEHKQPEIRLKLYIMTIKYYYAAYYPSISNKLKYPIISKN